MKQVSLSCFQNDFREMLKVDVIIYAKKLQLNYYYTDCGAPLLYMYIPPISSAALYIWLSVMSGEFYEKKETGKIYIF